MEKKLDAESWLNENAKSGDWDRLHDVLADFIPTSNVIKYMEEYASQETRKEAIGFAEWAYRQELSFLKSDNKWYGRNFTHGITTSELFDQYKQQI